MQKNHLKQDFETYQKCIRDFKTRPKFSETHIFFTYIVPFYTPLEDVFHKGFQLWGGGGGGTFVRFELRFAATDMPTLACEQQTYFRSSLLSLRYFSEGEKRRLEIHLLFAGYANPC